MMSISTTSTSGRARRSSVERVAARSRPRRTVHAVPLEDARQREDVADVVVDDQHLLARERRVARSCSASSMPALAPAAASRRRGAGRGRSSSRSRSERARVACTIDGLRELARSALVVRAARSRRACRRRSGSVSPRRARASRSTSSTPSMSGSPRSTTTQSKRARASSVERLVARSRRRWCWTSPLPISSSDAPALRVVGRRPAAGPSRGRSTQSARCRAASPSSALARRPASRATPSAPAAQAARRAPRRPR